MAENLAMMQTTRPATRRTTRRETKQTVQPTLSGTTLSVGIPPRAGTSWLDIDSPLGRLRLVGNDRVVTAVVFDEDAEVVSAGIEPHHREATVALAEQLDQYFGGERRDFDVTLALTGTPFQLLVWGALLTIQYGQTASYSRVAAHIDHPRAHRAVGSANRRNPVPIIVPCHRVNSVGGKLAGYGGGLDRKRFLLDLELGNRNPAPIPPCA